MKTAIVIPARYASTRFPGKPLAPIAGRSMLSRVVEKGLKAADGDETIDVMVATDDERIAAHARELNVHCVMTDPLCATGSDRVLAAARATGKNYTHLISLQGDAPFTPEAVLRRMIDTMRRHPEHEVVTPVHRLSWDGLDALREAKKTTPFSGTTCVRADDGHALWFSKNIIPALRDEQKLRARGNPSPVWQHMGLYGYRAETLARYVVLPQSPYEILEGLEQLRFLENGIRIMTIEADGASGLLQAGIDSPEDVVRAEALLKKNGDA